MTKFARLTDADNSGARSVIEVVDAANAAAIATMFHPSIASQFIQVPAAARPGSIKNGSSWQHPEMAADPETAAPARRLQLSPPEFKLAFTVGERLAVKSARTYAGTDGDALLAKAILDDWFEIIEDPRLTHVDLALPATIAGVNYLISLAILTEQRAGEILSGVPA